MFFSMLKKIFSNLGLIKQADDVIDLDSWRLKQVNDYGFREGLDELLLKKREQILNGNTGLSGSFIDTISNISSTMIPIEAWGGERGWKSNKRRKNWYRILEENEIEPINPEIGILARFQFNPCQWVPHPYCPPQYCLIGKNNFVNYITNAEGAYELSLSWDKENSEALTEKLNKLYECKNITLVQKRNFVV